MVTNFLVSSISVNIKQYAKFQLPNMVLRLSQRLLVAGLVLSTGNAGFAAGIAASENASTQVNPANPAAIIAPLKLSQDYLDEQDKPTLPSTAGEQDKLNKTGKTDDQKRHLVQNIRPSGKQMLPAAKPAPFATPASSIPEPAPAPSTVSPRSMELTPPSSQSRQTESATSSTSGSSAGSSSAPNLQTEGSITATAGSKTPLLSVRAVLNYAIIKSPRIAAVRSQLGIQEALYAAATQMPNPFFFEDNGVYAEEVRRIGATVTYDPPWKIAFRMLAAKKQVKETKLEILNTLWQFRNDVRRAYTELGVAQESYQILVDLYELADRLYEVTSKRFQAGDVPELDVLKARLAVSQASIDRDVGLIRIQKAEASGKYYDGPPFR